MKKSKILNVNIVYLYNMKYLILALTCCFFFKTFLDDKMVHADSLEKNHSELTHFTENIQLDCHSSKENSKPMANDSNNDESSCPHDCDLICLCLHSLSLQYTIMITNEEKNNFFSNSSKKIYTGITNFTSLIINPPERPPIYNS